METRAETDAALAGVNADFTHRSLVISVGSDDDVNVFHDTLESLVQSFLIKLELEKSAIHLVHEQNGLDAFTNGLSQDSLSLHADTRDTINDNQGSVSDTESSSYFR